MSTRASIKLSDGYDTFFLYRHSNGFPDVIVPDIEAVIEKTKWNFNGGAGLFISVFFGEHYDPKRRIQNYELTTGIHGDESYCYEVEWVDSEWKITKAR